MHENDYAILVNGWFVRDSNLSPTQRLMILDWALRQGSGDDCFPGVGRTAEDIQVNHRTVDRNMPAVKQSKYLSGFKRRGHKGHTNSYKVRLTNRGKMPPLLGAKCPLNVFKPIETDPVFEEPVGLKAGAKRETPAEKLKRKYAIERTSRLEQLKQANQQSEQQKPPNPPDKEVNHGTE